MPYHADIVSLSFWFSPLFFFGVHCTLKKNILTKLLFFSEIDQSEVQNRITNDWICPHKRVITEAIQTVYSWTWNRENPDWRSVRKKLKSALDSTDFEY